MHETFRVFIARRIMNVAVLVFLMNVAVLVFFRKYGTIFLVTTVILLRTERRSM